MFPKYLIEYQNIKKVKSKFKSEKSNKIKHKCNVVLKENKKKTLKQTCLLCDLNICLLVLRMRTCEHYNSFYNKIHLNNVLVLILFFK